MSNFVFKKYNEFYKKHGHIPPAFNPYNCAEIKDIAPCITTECGGTTTSATVLIIESGKFGKDDKND